MIFIIINEYSNIENVSTYIDFTYNGTDIRTFILPSGFNDTNCYVSNFLGKYQGYYYTTPKDSTNGFPYQAHISENKLTIVKAYDATWDTYRIIIKKY